MKLGLKAKKEIIKFLKNHKLSETIGNELCTIIENINDKQNDRFLDVIVNNLSNESIFFENKTAFNNLCFLNLSGIKKLARKIKYCIDSSIKSCNQDFVFRYDYEKQNIKDVFSIKWSNKKNREVIGVAENNLERLITVVNDENNTEYTYINQFPTPDSGHIDLVYFNNVKDEINIVELKQWISGDNPLYAIVELIKNHYLLFSEKNDEVRTHFKLKQKYNKINLILLAPKDYYEQYKLSKEFYMILEELNKIMSKQHITIILKYISVTRKDCETKIRQKYGIFSKEKLPIENLHWKDFLNNSIRDKLDSNNWNLLQ